MKKFDFSKIIKNTGIFVLTVIVSTFGVKATIINFPTLSVLASDIAIASAGVSCPEGGIEFLAKSFNPANAKVIDIFEKAELIDDQQNPTPQKSKYQTPQPPTIPTPTPEGSGKIIRTQYTGGPPPLHIPIGNNAFIKNLTKHSFDEVATMSKAPMDFKLKKSKDIQVLIMHTHATEGFEDKISDFYDLSHNSRTTDNNKNIVAVGDMIAKELEKSGIGVAHDKTQHDYPSYSGSYNRSAKTVSSYLKKYPSIKIVLDVHRDGITLDNKSIIAPSTKINGRSAAQIMIISGCDNGKFNMPNYPKNLAFASALQRQLEKDYNGITRPILFDFRKYNQNLTTGSILLEVGSQGSSLDEAKYTGELIGKSLSKLAE